MTRIASRDITMRQVLDVGEYVYDLDSVDRHDQHAATAGDGLFDRKFAVRIPV